jgi:hypothetical protein
VDSVLALNSRVGGSRRPAPLGPHWLINMETTFFDEFISVSQAGEMQQLCKTLFKDLRHLRKPQNPIILPLELQGVHRDQSHI